MPEYTAKVSLEDSGKRLDIFLLGFFKDKDPGLSRTAIQKLISDGAVNLSGSVDLKRHQKVKFGDGLKIKFEKKPPAAINGEDISLEVVYEDEDLAVVNKPIGMVVHPAPGNQEHTLVNALLHRFKKLSDINPRRPGIVHRLDKETSGLLVVAKNNAAHLDLAKQFEEHSIERKYIAVVKGKVEFDESVIEAPIGRHPDKRESMSVSYAENTRYARTYYRVMKRSNDFSLLELKPFTGRTHQLRVHLAFIGYPIVGDDKYGKRGDFERMYLHAKEIGFIHPRTKKAVSFSSDIPKGFKELLNQKKP